MRRLTSPHPPFVIMAWWLVENRVVLLLLHFTLVAASQYVCADLFSSYSHCWLNPGEYLRHCQVLGWIRRLGIQVRFGFSVPQEDISVSGEVWTLSVTGECLSCTFSFVSTKPDKNYFGIYRLRTLNLYIKSLHTGCFTTLGHNCRRWFPRSLWSKKFI
jgi:hypothetical protein